MSCFIDRARRSSFQTMSVSPLLAYSSASQGISDYARHLLDEDFLAPCLSERILLQGEVLIERRNAGSRSCNLVREARRPLVFFGLLLGAGFRFFRGGARLVLIGLIANVCLSQPSSTEDFER
jgi:hypothetical protein